jgi:periplasmic protein TonB
MKALTSIAAVVVLVAGFAPTLAQEQIFESGPGITLPIPVKEVKPQYTPRAMAERVQGTVWMKVVVRPDGKTSDIVVEKALHPELDEQAVAALRQWEFKPGSREGKPVPVRVTVEMTFTLKQ